LVDLQRQHLGALRRSVVREEPLQAEFSDQSLDVLAKTIAPETSGPLSVMVRQERLAQMRSALALLEEQQREVLVLRYLEGLPLQEVAEVMGTTVASTKMRHMRAIRRLREILQTL
jgi:RNA polymerase sigma-70 factor (ECF subfamily)